MSLHLFLTTLSAFLAIFAGVYHAYLLGKRLVPNCGTLASYSIGGILFLALISISQTAFFYLNIPLNSQSDFWSLLISCIAVHIITIHPIPAIQQDADIQEKWTAKRIFFGIILLICSCISFAYIAHAAYILSTTDSIRSPWLILPWGILPAIGFSWFSAFLSARCVRSSFFSLLHTILGIISITSITCLLYKVGYGFDGFLHIRGEKILSETGTLFPKPPYYIGQYVFVTWLARLLRIPNAITIIDTWLVPVFSAILLPLVLYIREKKSAYTFLIFLFLPLSAFIATTPQSFAYVLGIAAIICVMTSGRAAILLALWSICVHPLAGIPFFLLSLALYTKYKKIPGKVFAGFLALASGFSIPLIFIFISSNNGTHITWDFSHLIELTPWLTGLQNLAPTIHRTYSLWPGFASLISQALPCILILILCIEYIRKKMHETDIDDTENKYILILAAISLFISSIILKTAGDFAFLIDYEKGNFADRLQTISFFCLWAAAIPACISFFTKIKKMPMLHQALTLWLLCSIPTALAYTALPRHDALLIGHGWSVSASDIEAVRFIHHDAGSIPYVVLANQSVSAAAVSELGFKRYAGDIFFYPIPTGGPLYTIFLDIANAKRIQDNVQDAAKLAEAKIVYVVIDDYWWNAESVNDALSIEASDQWTIGSVKIFKFIIKSSN